MCVEELASLAPCTVHNYVVIGNFVNAEMTLYVVNLPLVVVNLSLSRFTDSYYFLLFDCEFQ